MGRTFVVMMVLVVPIALAHADEPVPVAPAAPEQPPGDASSEAPASRVTPSPPTAPMAPMPDMILVTDHDYEPPPLSPGRLAGEFLVGGLFMAGGAVGGAFLGELVDPKEGCLVVCAGGAIGGITGITLVAPMGVYLVGTSGDQTGSLGATIGGSAIGTLVALGAILVDEESAVGLFALMSAPVVGAMIGFNVTRRYDRSHALNPRWVPVASVSGDRATFGVMGRF